MRYHAILFDLDGTLVDTMSQYQTVMVSMLQQHGTDLSDEQFWDLYRRQLPLVEWLQHCGIDPLTAPAFRSERDRRYIELLRTGTTWLDCADQLLSALRRHGPVGIVTSSWRTYVEAQHEALNLLEYLDVCVTADDVGTKTKPDPYPLQLACSTLGRAPHECLYIGDQAVDIAAAQAAGMDGWLVLRPWTDPTLNTGSTPVLDDLACLPQVLGL